MSNAKAPAKEIERNKQTIANLLKLPENRLCAECGAKGTAAVGVAVAAGAEKPTLGVFFFFVQRVLQRADRGARVPPPPRCTRPRRGLAAPPLRDIMNFITWCVVVILVSMVCARP